jgi:hypothetical protein
MERSNEVKVVVAILLIAAVPVYARAEIPTVPRVSQDDAQKVGAIISADKVKTQTYCDIQELGEQIERASERRDIKLVAELFQKIDSLEKTLGPEYAALLDGLQDIDPESEGVDHTIKFTKALMKDHLM